jgi:prepilin-type processing-associated H-X9-DG protein
VSYLLNSQLSHKTRRWGRWTFVGLMNDVGTSNFITYVERNADAILADNVLAGDPRQDDFDLWVDVLNFQNWIATQRHAGFANYLYLDGHAAAYSWPTGDLAAVPAINLFPDSFGQSVPSVRLNVQGFYATETSNDDPWVSP